MSIPKTMTHRGSMAHKWRPPSALIRKPRQAGAFGIMFAPLLIVFLGFCALALDLGRLYNRKTDMSGYARTVALAAARELNGTTDGITNATAQARTAANRLRYQHFGAGATVGWDDDALSFSTAPDRSGTWIPAASAGSSAPTLFYAKVDTAKIKDDSGDVRPLFIQILTGSISPIRITDSAIAGRAAINITPIAVCAMGDAATARSAIGPTGAVQELVQYGFRRGVSYDLMQLNPKGTEPASYGVNPVSAPGSVGNSFNLNTLGSFMCTGTMWVPRVTGTIHVSRLPSTAPLSGLFKPLNSRFDDYVSSACDPSGAPPDYNVQPYAYNVANTVKWMSPGSGRAAALTTTMEGKLQTVADVATTPSSAGDYGPLWAYAKAVKAPSPLNAPEPATGYTTFGTAEWSTIYKSGPTASAYPSTSPYESTSARLGHYLAPSSANLEMSSLQRRVLNLPLLDCGSGLPGGTNTDATVLAIGKFFMTVPATSSALIAEFAGVIQEQNISSQLEVYP